MPHEPVPTDPSGSTGPDLLGPEAVELLDVVLGTVGGRRLTHEVHAVHHRPGDGLSVGYRVTVDRGEGPVAEDYLVLSTARPRALDPHTPGLVVLHGERGRVLAWRFPDDPLLPGLATACDPVRVVTVLPARPRRSAQAPTVELVGYRPLRRAVVRVTHAGTVHYVKVLRPHVGATGGLADVVHRHRLLRTAGLPVPEVEAVTEDGLVVLAEATGFPLVEAVGRDGAAGVGATELTALLDRLPAEVLDLPRRTAWSDRAVEMAALLDGTPWRARAADLAGEVRDRSAGADLGPTVPTHGDVHDGQLTVVRDGDAWRLAGLLDVDTVGPGHRVDDLACLLGHAVTLGPAGAATADRWRRELVADAPDVDPDALVVRSAGVLLSLAAGARGATEAGSAPPGQDVAGLLDLAEAELARTPR